MSERAFKIGCADADHGNIVVFAENRNEARHMDRREDCDCEFIEIEIRRAPEFDHLSPGPVTVRQYLDHDWYWWCACGRQVWNDDSPIVIGEHVICSQECLDRELSHVRRTVIPASHESMIRYRDALEEYVQAQVVGGGTP